METRHAGSTLRLSDVSRSVPQKWTVVGKPSSVNRGVRRAKPPPPPSGRRVKKDRHRRVEKTRLFFSVSFFSFFVSVRRMVRFVSSPPSLFPIRIERADPSSGQHLSPHSDRWNTESKKFSQVPILTDCPSLQLDPLLIIENFTNSIDYRFDY